MSLFDNIKYLSAMKISGPVSMYVLKPTPDLLANNPYAPIFILFGDHHRGIENLCSNSYSDNDVVQDIENRNIYQVYNKYFLELLSNSVEKKEKKEKNDTVDFYLEGGELHIIPRPADPTPMGNLWGWFNICYKNSRKEETKQAKMEDLCSRYAKNIRWQSGDLRHFRKFNELHPLQHFLDNFISRLLFYPSNDYNYFCYMCRYELINLDARYKGDFLKTVIDPYKVFDQFIYRKGGSSLVKKQMDKIKDDYLKKNLLDRFRDQILYVHKTYIINYLATIEKVNDIVMKLLKTELYSQEEKKNIDDFWDVKLSGDLVKYHRALSTINTTIADLYLIARSYKVMDNLKHKKDPSSARPMINVVYFGDFHAQNIDRFLREKYGGKSDYTLAYQIPTNPTTYENVVDNVNFTPGVRCLELDKYVDLKSTIANLRTIRDTYEMKKK